MDRIIGFFMTQPRRLIALGRACVATGGFIVITGVVGWAALRMVGTVTHRAPPNQALDSLASLYPTLWTWWVPETLLGMLPALVLIALGFWLAALGRNLRRY